MAGSSAILGEKPTIKQLTFHKTYLEIPPRQLYACYPSRPNTPEYLDHGKKGE
jgi:hypothetical protein